MVDCSALAVTELKYFLIEFIIFGVLITIHSDVIALLIVVL